MKKSHQLTMALAIGLLPSLTGLARPLGVDVSNNNGSVNWSTIKSDGITFAWAKATEGTTFTDSYYSGNISNGKAAGLMMGGYDFSHPDSYSPSAEANYFWGVAGGTIVADGKTLMPTLDFETFSGYVGASSYSDWANQWCSSIQSKASANGVVITPIIYTTTSEACNFNTSVAQWGVWIAQPDNGNPQTGNAWEDGGCEEWGSGVWNVWQYHWPSSAGNTLSYMDLDVFNGSSITPLVATKKGVKGVDDFDGDGIPDFVNFRSTNSNWYVRLSHNGADDQFQFGASGDIPLLGGAYGSDFDGDGIPDATIFRPSNGNWYVRYSSNPGADNQFQFGTNGDIPKLGGDFDGDGIPDAVIFRPSKSDWYVRYSHDGSTHEYAWGTNGDIPVLGGDFDGDGIPDFVNFRPSNANWYVRNSSNGSDTQFQFGANGDIPLLGGDFDGDGKPDAVVFRPSNGNWYIRYSSNPGADHQFQFGTNGDIPMLGGDFDGDGIPDVIVYRPSTQVWYVRYSSDGSTHSYAWGTTGDIPVH